MFLVPPPSSSPHFSRRALSCCSVPLRLSRPLPTWKGTTVARGMREPPEHGRQLVGSTVVQEMAPTPRVNPPWQQDGDLGIAAGQCAGHEVDRRSHEPAVAAFPDLQRKPADHETLPVFLQELRHLVVQEEMDGPYFVRVQAAGVLDSASGGQVETVHEHQDDVAAQDGHFGRFEGALFELLRLACGTGGSGG